LLLRAIRNNQGGKFVRKWHRWVSVFFGVFLLWIAVTGVLSQIGSLVNNGGFEREERAQGQRQAAAVSEALVPSARAHGDDDDAAQAKPAPPAATPAAEAAPFVCPVDMTCRPKRQARPGDWNLGLLHHLHSGESFGPLGTVISLLSGLAMVFFAFSGLWMYVRMWSHRRGNAHKPAWFWK
jgi:uncharacterized iron-regulated membrane protein